MSEETTEETENKDENTSGEGTGAEAENTEAKKYFETLFRSKAAETGGVIRRNKESVLKHCTLDELQDVLYDKCYKMIGVGDQFIIICSVDPIKIY